MSCQHQPRSGAQSLALPWVPWSQYLVFGTVVTARAHKEVQSIQLPVLSSPVKRCPSQLTRKIRQ